MKQKRTSVVSDAPYRVAIVTLDGHLSSAATRALAELRVAMPNLELGLHCAGEWAGDDKAVARCIGDIESADLVIACMLFMDEHIQTVLPALKARRDQCDAMVCFMSDGEVMKLTRLGQFSMAGKARGPMALLKKLRGGNKKKPQVGAKQVAMLARLPRILKFIPGTAQDVRAYFLAMQYWLAGSQKNIVNLVASLVNRYANEQSGLRGNLKVAAPETYPDVGLYHPRAKVSITDQLGKLPRAKKDRRGTVGVLLMRSYVLAGNARHYDRVIEGLEGLGYRVIPAFASGLDSRPAIEKFFMKSGVASVDAVVSLTGFSLVGGPAFNDANAASELLKTLDVPYIAAHASEFQSLDQWSESERGLLPVETTMMVAIPELDGAVAPTLFAGRANDAAAKGERDMVPHETRIEALVARVDRLVTLRRAERAERTIGIVLFNFPPNAGATGTAAFLAVFESLFNTLKQMAAAGYQVEVPASVDALREAILEGNREQYGTEANVLEQIPVDDYVRREPHLAELEAQWGPAPGKILANGRGIFVMGARFGNVIVAVQPSFGYEGDPMRLLFEKGHTPTHAFSAFYRYLREDAGVHALLNFGTHGALEFMPGKQVGMSDKCWPERLIGDLPNFYLYAANNPSEGAIAKRRSAATLISYLTPPVVQTDLYKGLGELQVSVDRFRALAPEDDERLSLAATIQSQAAPLELASAEPLWAHDQLDTNVAALMSELDALRKTLIPLGMHVVGEPMTQDDRRSMLTAVADMETESPLPEDAVDQIMSGALKDSEDPRVVSMIHMNEQLAVCPESDAIVHALDGGYIPPVVGGDVLKSPDILPTGRNIHGFDPFRIPSVHAMNEGARQAELLLTEHHQNSGKQPESIAFVLWGTDNIKSEGRPVAQAMALMGARPRYDNYGRLSGAMLIDLETLGRPRIDVLMTLSGIFRDILPQQAQMLAEAAFLAADADEPLEQNFVRKHALAHQAETGCDFETAALRVFSNADGAYGSNVNHMVDNGRWEDEDELAETYSRRKCFAFGRNGVATRQPQILQRALKSVDIAYQNLESVELGVTTVDHYFDTLGGITKAAQHASGRDVEVYIGDQTSGRDAVRTLASQVAIETRSRVLNPQWYESMLKHGYEGVRQIESHVTNTMGLSATTGKVDPWVYQHLTETYLLDPEMRERLAELNPAASARVAGRLMEAHERNYWTPDAETLEKLKEVGDEFDDRLEGIEKVVAA
ncbi:MAG: magnesium chelatase subunit H [Gammaproteobacteria bacterium]